MVERHGEENDDRLASLFKVNTTLQYNISETYMHVIWQDGERFSDRFMVQEMTNPTSWHLLKRQDNSEPVMEEAVFTIQGIITRKDLPPIIDKPR